MRTLLAAAFLALIAPPALAFPSPVSGSYYHSKFHGRPMACGGTFRNDGFTAASNHHPCGSLIEVSYRGRSVVVEVTDRCGRCGIDLSRAAARQLGLLNIGRAKVRVERLN
jgi:rare lipoprotein A